MKRGSMKNKKISTIIGQIIGTIIIISIVGIAVGILFRTLRLVWFGY